MGPTWGPSGADRTQMGPMLTPWTLLSGMLSWHCKQNNIPLLWTILEKNLYRCAHTYNLKAEWVKCWQNTLGTKHRSHTNLCDRKMIHPIDWIQLHPYTLQQIDKSTSGDKSRISVPVWEIMWVWRLLQIKHSFKQQLISEDGWKKFPNWFCVWLYIYIYIYLNIWNM